MKIVGSSDIGKIRKFNEDAFRFGEIEEGVAWIVVCDGMGGTAGGQIASQITTEMVSKKIEQCYKSLMGISSLENIILSAVTTANVTVFDRSLTDDQLAGMGTTIVVAIIKNGTACIAHVGDSRAYAVRNSGKLELITKDHSLVQEMLDLGQINQEQFETHPIKNIITRAVGVNEKIDIDFDIVEFEKGDSLLICTDGLSGTVRSDEILKIYNETKFEDLPKKYIDEANINGGKDNTTVVIAKFEGECE